MKFQHGDEIAKIANYFLVHFTFHSMFHVGGQLGCWQNIALK
jgi:hypothetical protein